MAKPFPDTYAAPVHFIGLVRDVDPLPTCVEIYSPPHFDKGDRGWVGLPPPRPLTHAGLPFKDLKSGK